MAEIQTTLENLGTAMGLAPQAAPVQPPKPRIDAKGRAYATGKRKNAVARVWIKRGKGKITVNDKELTTYFARSTLRMLIEQPLKAASRMEQFDVVCTVSGGGLSGQAGAVRHGLSKALTFFEPELRPVLKKGGFLTRDSRVVERKKYGARQGPPQLPVLEAVRDADALQAAGEQTFIGLLAGDHRQDLEFGEVAPICHPALEKRHVGGFHEHETFAHVGTDPALDEGQAGRRHAALVTKAPVNRLAVATAEILDAHEQHADPALRGGLPGGEAWPIFVAPLRGATR